MSYNPKKGNAMSTLNSTTTLLLAGQTFTGGWETVVDFTSISVSVLGTNATDGVIWIDVRKAGSTIVNSVPFFKTDITSNPTNIPLIWNVVEAEVRVRYVNGATDQLTEWFLTTKFSNGQQSELLTTAGGQINENTPVSTHKSVITGKNPNNEYTDVPAPGIINSLSTSDLLGIGGIWTSAWHRVEQYGEIKASMLTDVPPADCRLELSFDGTTVHTSLSLPPQLNPVTGKYSFIHALNPSLPYFRIKYTNDGVAQAEFDFISILLVNSGNGFVSRATQVLDRYTDVKNMRIVNSPEQDRNFGLINYQEAKRKFGTNTNVGTSFEDIVPDTSGVIFPTANETIRVKAAGNANDTAAGSGAQKVYVEALDENGLEITIELITAGASASAPSTELVSAINKAYTKGKNAGPVVIENTTSTEVLAYVETGFGTTRQMIYTVPSNKTAWVEVIYPSVANGNSCDLQILHYKDIDGLETEHFEWGILGFLGATPIERKTFLKFDAGSRFKGQARKHDGSGTAAVSFDVDIILTDN